MEEITDVDDALNEYYKLKRKFETNLETLKKEILSANLSRREKRAHFLKIQPKCINCNKPSKVGTFFSTERIITEEKTYRKLKCHCGNILNPCGLNIELHLGDSEPLDELMHDIQDEIKVNKKNIILDKNKLLFGLITTEAVLENFEFNKTYITELTNLYSKYLEVWNHSVDNSEKKAELKNAILEYHTHVDQIKASMQQMSTSNSTHYANEVANLYIHQLKPLLDKIRHLKYATTSIYMDESSHCRLIQLEHMFSTVYMTDFQSKIVSYSTGLQKPEIKIRLPLSTDAEMEDFSDTDTDIDMDR